MMTTLIIIMLMDLLLTAVAVIMLMELFSVKKEVQILLDILKKWITTSENIRDDAHRQADRVTKKTDQLASVVVSKVPQMTADKVVERLQAESTTDSGKLPVITPKKES